MGNVDRVFMAVTYVLEAKKVEGETFGITLLVDFELGVVGA